MIQPVKIFSAEQIKQADRFTIEHEPIASIDLMERAATQCAAWIRQRITKENKFSIFCGQGNNGGDGLAIARLLLMAGYDIQVWIINETGNPSDDFIINKERLEKLNPSCVHAISSVTDIPQHKENIIIDAIFGTGLSREITGLAAECIHAINASEKKIISIDMPSGLFADKHTADSSAVIKADHTVSFQFPKLAFFFPENETYVGDWEILPIGLHPKFIDEEPAAHYIITMELVSSMIKPRKKFSHKGNFGHALLIAGSYGKIGAAILATRACLKSGVGLLTVHLPQCGYTAMQAANPEAMVSVDSNEKIITDEIVTTTFSSTGIGPGIGTDANTQKTLYHVLTHADKPMVLDADALNIIALNKGWLDLIPANSILTPHPKEFERIAGKTENDFERHELQISFSRKYKLFVVLKGAHTCITTPSGDSYFNSTGNPGMAKGGTGDVLTGVVTALLAQGYNSLEACLISVFVHGLAGDLASNEIGETGMTARDLCNYLPLAFKKIESVVLLNPLDIC